MNSTHYTRYALRNTRKRHAIKHSNATLYITIVAIALLYNVIATLPIYESIIVALS